MRMGRRITVLAVGLRRRGSSWNLGKGASLEEVHKRMGSSGGAGEVPCLPVATDQFAPYSEGSRGRKVGAERGEWEGKGKGGEKEEEGGRWPENRSEP